MKKSLKRKFAKIEKTKQMAMGLFIYFSIDYNIDYYPLEDLGSNTSLQLTMIGSIFGRLRSSYNEIGSRITVKCMYA